MQYISDFYKISDINFIEDTNFHVIYRNIVLEKNIENIDHQMWYNIWYLIDDTAIGMTIYGASIKDNTITCCYPIVLELHKNISKYLYITNTLLEDNKESLWEKLGNLKDPDPNLVNFIIKLVNY